MEFKCCCGEENCKIALQLSPGEVRLYDKGGEESLMYVDANTTVDLIVALKKNLIAMTEEEQ